MQPTNHPHYQLLTEAVTVTAGATAVTWLPMLDMWMRIGASLVAVIAGTLTAIVAIRTLRKK